ncbi:MAG: hypothetical protein ACEPOW_05750 [Bacteroidales bacterium]
MKKSKIWLIMLFSVLALSCKKTDTVNNTPLPPADDAVSEIEMQYLSVIYKNANTVVLTANLITKNSTGLLKYGFVIGKNTDITESRKEYVAEYSSAKGLTLRFAMELNELENNQKYYFQGFAEYKNNRYYTDNIGIFIVTDKEYNDAEVYTLAAENIEKRSATLKGLFLGGLKTKINSCGFFYGNSSNELNKTIYSEDCKTCFKSKLVDLKVNTTYYYKAFIGTDSGILYSEEKSFTTKNLGKDDYDMELIVPQNNDDPFILKALIKQYGKSNITKKGFYYGEKCDDLNILVESHKPIDEDMFGAELSGLEDRKKYYCRAFIIDSKGIRYLSDTREFFFIKNSFQNPVLRTLKPEEVTPNSAILRGIMIESGTDRIKTQGFYIGENPTDLDLEVKVLDIQTKGVFEAKTTYKLKSNTKYYYRAYVTTEKGRFLGCNTENFTTK